MLTRISTILLYVLVLLAPTPLYANPHAATSIGGTATSTYDNNGNLLTYKAAGVATSTYTWDYRNRMTQSVVAGNATSYGYDINDQRVQMGTTLYPFTLYNTQGSTSTITKHIFANGQAIADIQGSGATTSVYYLHNDNLNSTNVVGNSSSNVDQLYAYYPYGAQRVAEKSGSFTEQRQYIGQYYDEDTALSYLNARYYDGARGQFTSQDPTHLAIGDQSRLEQITGQSLQQVLSDPQQLNSYAYARNNPITYSDPEGEWVHIAAGALIGGGIGLAGQGLQDILSGGFSGYEAYAGAAAGGTTFGAVTAATGGLSLIGYGAVGIGAGAVQSGVQQGLSISTGRQESFNGSQFVGNTVVSGFTSAIPGLKIAPVTLGKGSFASVEKQIYTKLQNGIISVGGIQPSTYGKIITSNVAQQGPGTVAQSALGAISRQLSQISATLSGIISSLKSSQEKKK